MDNRTDKIYTVNFMVNLYNPHIDQTSTTGRTFRVFGLEVEHNEKGYLTGITKHYIRYDDGERKILMCKNDKILRVEDILVHFID